MHWMPLGTCRWEKRKSDALQYLGGWGMPGMQGRHRAWAKNPRTPRKTPWALHENECEPWSFRSQTTSWGRLLYIPPFYGRMGYSWKFSAQERPTNAISFWGHLWWVATIRMINSCTLDEAHLYSPPPGCKIMEDLPNLVADWLEWSGGLPLTLKVFLSTTDDNPPLDIGHASVIDALNQHLRHWFDVVFSLPPYYISHLWQLPTWTISQAFNFCERWKYTQSPSDI